MNKFPFRALFTCIVCMIFLMACEWVNNDSKDAFNLDLSAPEVSVSSHAGMLKINASGKGFFMGSNLREAPVDSRPSQAIQFSYDFHLDMLQTSSRIVFQDADIFPYLFQSSRNIFCQ